MQHVSNKTAAVVGAGINGVMIAWELLKHGYSVTVFERHTVMSQTSSASSKLLHGGLRYLENGEFRLVREALRERQWWIQQAPHLAHPLKLYIPIYQSSRRPAWMYKIGLFFYDFLAGKQNIGNHHSLSKAQIQQDCPELKSEELVGGFSYYDGQMDDASLGEWALEQAKLCANENSMSLNVLEYASVLKITTAGEVSYSQFGKHVTQKFDKIVNVAGPWAEQLLKQSQINPEYSLDLVRGSHLLVDRRISQGYFLEIPNERRIFFVLPYKGQVLIGTTEMRQGLDDEACVSQEEIEYLINAYNHYFKTPITKECVVQSFAGLRPLIKSAENPNQATREYAVQKTQNLLTVFGGKWTTARQLALKVSGMLN